MPAARKLCGAAVCALALLSAPAATEAKEVYTLELPKFLKGYWNVAIGAAADVGATRGHLEFEQDPADRDSLIADYYEFPIEGESSRRKIRETEDDAALKTSPEGAVLMGRVQVLLGSPSAGTLLFTPAGDEGEAEELFHFSYTRNTNMLHTAQGIVKSPLEALGYSAFQSTIVAANHIQVTGFGKSDVEDKFMVTTLSAKKGVAESKQESFLSKWAPSALVFVFFIASKFLRKKYGKGSDFMKERQGMAPKARTMPPPAQKKND